MHKQSEAISRASDSSKRFQVLSEEWYLEQACQYCQCALHARKRLGEAAALRAEAGKGSSAHDAMRMAAEDVVFIRTQQLSLCTQPSLRAEINSRVGMAFSGLLTHVQEQDVSLRAVWLNQRSRGGLLWLLKAHTCLRYVRVKQRKNSTQQEQTVKEAPARSDLKKCKSELCLNNPMTIKQAARLRPWAENLSVTHIPAEGDRGESKPRVARAIDDGERGTTEAPAKFHPGIKPYGEPDILHRTFSGGGRNANAPPVAVALPQLPLLSCCACASSCSFFSSIGELPLAYIRSSRVFSCTMSSGSAQDVAVEHFLRDIERRSKRLHCAVIGCEEERSCSDMNLLYRKSRLDWRQREQEGSKKR
ncbi:hypothetical protein CCH79_00002015 [Gambusia affinis]|uniref:Uncharacterized protein n=1 Tax=Gambusia affinis TaxID=33528 RepID=A0A315VJY0_GAMAF|nr:hypothetical protein CCH79_00002015 [Gambusia affinis]